MHGKLRALQFQHRDDAHVIIPLQCRVVRDEHRQAAGKKCFVARRKMRRPSVAPSIS